MVDRTTLLDEAQVDRRLAGAPGWERRGQALHREVSFRDFREAWGFMAMVALAAERLDHHPDWCNSWNKVAIDVTNHQAGGLTEVDFALVEAIDRALGEQH